MIRSSYCVAPERTSLREELGDGNIQDQNRFMSLRWSVDTLTKLLQKRGMVCSPPWDTAQLVQMHLLNKLLTYCLIGKVARLVAN